jgi:hypothetical protein
LARLNVDVFPAVVNQSDRSDEPLQNN